MSVITWGLLAKSQIDNETIEEAIARLIAVHNEDETAHLGSGQSLQSHKASEIIDHVVASIVADKIKNGEITRSHLSPDAVVLLTENFDKGNIIDFVDFSSSTSGSGYINKTFRISHVKTGTTQNSVAKIYTLFGISGDMWYPTGNLEFAFFYRIGEYWGYEVQPGGEIYLKFGSGTNADMGSSSDKCFGLKLEDQANGRIKVTGFARDLSDLSTLVLATDLQLTDDYVFLIKKAGSSFYFYINGVFVGEIINSISGSVGSPYLTHVAKNPLAGSESEGQLNSFSYYIPLSF